jgi:hypothetical protein
LTSDDFLGFVVAVAVVVVVVVRFVLQTFVVIEQGAQLA